MGLSKNTIAPLFVINISNGYASFLRYELNGISFEGTDFSYQSLEKVASAKILKTGGISVIKSEITELADIISSDFYKAIRYWESIGKPVKWTCSFGTDYIELNRRERFQKRIADGRLFFESYDKSAAVYLNGN